jgi:hypothetical protein
MNTKPYIGQRVRLNDVGYRDLHLTSADAIRQSTEMRITGVENMGGRGGPDIWAIDVDQPLIDMFMLHAGMVDPI